MRNTITLLLQAFVLVGGCSLLSPGCDDSSDPPKQCTYHGKLYDDQTQFPAADGCNSCFCNPLGNTPGQVGCTLVLCEGVMDAGSDAADAQSDSH